MRNEGAMKPSIRNHNVRSTVLVCLLAFSVLFPTTADGDESSRYGVNAHHLRLDTGDQNALAERVAQCGMGWIRVDFVWAWIETSQDSFDWSVMDAVVAAANAHGLEVFGTLAATPLWATSGPAYIGAPDNPADYYDFCYQAAARYQGSVDHWGMWNEANLSQSWAGTRQQFIDDILMNGADAIHAASSTAKMCGPELAHGSEGAIWLKECIEQAGDKIDILTHHAYPSNSANREYSDLLAQLEEPTLFGDDPYYWQWFRPSVKEVLEYTGWFGNKPFWLTETGFPSGDRGEAWQADSYQAFLTDWFTGDPTRDWIDKVFFYELTDYQAFPDLSWGILGPDPGYNPKPSYYVLQNHIPEPASAVLVVCGACGIVARRRRNS